ncbi:hypothetical protein RRG08_013437 [Elysia crispata]|uniref:Uncharacterized protein n=1 Tax=Elysia crispata TaxID=231223 RepID=A0AAE0ZNL7_9GAST|nr:hypothetical protein RRG08_013437 [Elysia crispata]
MFNRTLHPFSIDHFIAQHNPGDSRATTKQTILVAEHFPWKREVARETKTSNVGSTPDGMLRGAGDN